MASVLSSNNGGATPANVPSGQLLWPLPSVARRVPQSGGRSFGVPRTEIRHPGIDLLAAPGTPIIAPEAGTIVAFWPFVPPYVYAITLKTASQVLVFGEVQPDSLQKAGLKSPFCQGSAWSGFTSATYPKRETAICGPGSTVQAGQIIGFVGMMARSSMLHFEVYRPGKYYKVGGVDRWLIGSSPPSFLRDGTPYLLACAGQANAQDIADQLARAKIDASSKNATTRKC